MATLYLRRQNESILFSGAFDKKFLLIDLKDSQYPLRNHCKAKSIIIKKATKKLRER